MYAAVDNLSAHLIAVHADIPGIGRTALGDLSVSGDRVIALVDVSRCVTKSIVSKVKGVCSKERTVVGLAVRMFQ